MVTTSCRDCNDITVLPNQYRDDISNLGPWTYRHDIVPSAVLDTNENSGKYSGDIGTILRAYSHYIP
jgi:hypothetical protein